MKISKAFFLFACVAIPVLSWAQPKKDKIESLRIAYLTEKLDLTPDEAKGFWPVFNKFKDEMELVRKKDKDIVPSDDKISTLSDAEVDKIITEHVSLKEQQSALLKKYIPEFKKVLPSKKVLLLLKAEEDFKKIMLDKFKERKNPKPEN